MELLPALQTLRSRKAGLPSGGEQRMLAVGRALVSEPTCLLVSTSSWPLLAANHDLLEESYFG